MAILAETLVNWLFELLDKTQSPRLRLDLPQFHQSIGGSDAEYSTDSSIFVSLVTT
jgi:hypothetical protein